MTDRFVERYIPRVMGVLQREMPVWAGILILLFAMGFVLSERIPPFYLTPCVLIMAYIISEDIHRAFPMGNMAMVLILGRDAEVLCSRYIKACLPRLALFLLLSALTLSAGILLRLGPEGMGNDDFVALAYFTAASCILIFIRWICATRVGGKNAGRFMVWALLLALVPMIISAFTDWPWGTPLMAAVLVAFIILAEVIRLVWPVSKERMMGGI